MNPVTMTQTEHRRYRPPVGRRSGVGTGTTSLLMIFTVLCFATLAMLSLSTALANQRIQGRGLVRSQSLAAARGVVAEEVAGLDAELAALRAAGGSDAQAYEDKAIILIAMRGWQQSEDAPTTFTWVTPVDDANELVTVIRLMPQGAAARYTLVRQVSRLVAGWTPEEGGQLWDGGPEG